jgi:hypothetical protein
MLAIRLAGPEVFVVKKRSSGRSSRALTAQPPPAGTDDVTSAPANGRRARAGLECPVLVTSFRSSMGSAG